LDRANPKDGCRVLVFAKAPETGEVKTLLIPLLEAEGAAALHQQLVKHAPCQESSCPKTVDANLAQITVGMAGHYKHYERDQLPEDRERYAFAEQEASAKKAGLWAGPDRVPPWEWRKKR